MLLHSHSARAAARGALRTHCNSDRSKVFVSRLHRARVEPLESRHLLAVTVVTTTQDVLDPGDGLISLREAVIAANTSPADDEIQLPAGTYALTIQGMGENTALTGNLNIANNGSLKIVGAGADTTIIDAAALYPTTIGESRGGIFDIQSAVVRIEGLSLSGGVASRGGAVANDGHRCQQSRRDDHQRFDDRRQQFAGERWGRRWRNLQSSRRCHDCQLLHDFRQRCSRSGELVAWRRDLQLRSTDANEQHRLR
jgi:hypothetical protein